MTSSETTGFGTGSMVIGGAILLILLFGIFGGGFFGANGGRVAEAAVFNGGYNTTDRDLWKAHCETLQTQAGDTAVLQASLAALSSRTDLQTAALTDTIKNGEMNTLRDNLNQERALNIAKDAKIDNMQAQFFNMTQFNGVNSRLCGIENMLSTKLSTPPFYPAGSFAGGCPTSCCC